MPGFFTPPLVERYDLRAHLYEPAPRFPPAASETSGLQLTDADHATRKRSRQSDASSSASYSLNTNSWYQSLGYSRPSIRSPPPLANDRYELAGGMDVTDKFARQTGDFDDYFHLEKQRGMWSTPTSPQSGIPAQVQFAEQEITSGGTKPWMINQLMSIMGGVAGKLYQFCSVPFRGFQAGSGQAYSFDNQEVAAKLGLNEGAEQSQPKLFTQPAWASDSPDNNFGILSVESIEDDRPRVKRQRTTDNWVVVNNDGNTASAPPTPRVTPRRVPASVHSPSQIPRPVSRASMSTPAYKRQSLIPVSRRSALDRKPFHGSFSSDSRPQSSSGRPYSRQSYGSPVVSNEKEKKKKKKKSPLLPESQRLINKMRREELEDDARMRRMSSQMSAMLREAREALGSKFEVSDEFMDDENVNDDLYSSGVPLFPR